MLKSLSAKIGSVLILYGAWGIFAISFLDSSFVPLPLVNDLAVIMMASRRPAWWPFYALAATLGSLSGTYLLYAITRGGGRFIWRKTTPESISRARQWVKRNDFAAILVASLLPPPAPMKAFILTAGLLRVNAVRFGLALLVGRGLRFGAEAWLGARYGLRAQDYVRHNLAWASLALAVTVLAIALIRAWWIRRGVGQSGQSLPDSGGRAK